MAKKAQNQSLEELKKENEGPEERLSSLALAPLSYHLFLEKECMGNRAKRNE